MGKNFTARPPVDCRGALARERSLIEDVNAILWRQGRVLVVNGLLSGFCGVWWLRERRRKVTRGDRIVLEDAP